MKRLINLFIDSYSLLVALCVELCIAAVTFTIIAPGAIEKVAFGLLSAVIVLFALRSWLKNIKFLWALLAAITLFFNVSFALVATSVQSSQQESFEMIDDPILDSLYTRLETNRQDLKDYGDLYNQAVRESTVNSILEQMTQTRKTISEIEVAIEKRLYVGEQRSNTITADAIFYAIPNSIENKRYIELIIFLMIFTALELIIVIAATEESKKKLKTEEKMFVEIEKNPIHTIKKEPKRTGCESCGMYKDCKSPKLPSQGNGKHLIIFGQPDAKVDKSGEAYEEKYIQYFNDLLSKTGVSGSRVSYTYALQCYGEKIKPAAFQSCHERLIKTIEEIQPEHIYITDSIGLKVLYQPHLKSRINFNNYDAFTGCSLPDQELGIMVHILESPKEAYDTLAKFRDRLIAKRPDSNFSKDIWKDDFLKKNDNFRMLHNRLVRQIRDARKTKWKEYKNNKEITEDVNRACEILRHLNNAKILAWDIETSGLKPYVDGHFIYTIGFYDGEKSYSFPIFNDNKVFLTLLRRVMTNTKIKKWGSNIKYEHQWTREILGYWVQNWHRDAMISQHVLHNGSGRTSLKVMAFTRLGMLGFDTVESFLKSKSKSANALNNIHLAPMKDVLSYNADDAYVTYKIIELQEKEFDADPYIKKGAKLFLDNQLTFSKIERQGNNIDTVQAEKNVREIETKLGKLENQIKNHEVITKYWNKFQFNPNSGDHLIELFFDILQFPIQKWTDKGKPSTETSIMEMIVESGKVGSGLASLLLEYKQLIKIKDTFLFGILRETDNGKLHAGFNFNLVTSMRISSSSPNLQNMPKKNADAVRYIRSVFVPREGFSLIEADYGTLEALIGVAIHKDQTMKEYLVNPDADVHADNAELCFKCKQEDMPENLFKKLRSVAKVFTFGMQFGGGYVKIASSMWNMGVDEVVADYLKTKGINNYQEFEAEIQKAWQYYWNVQYGQLNEWRKDTWEEFIRNGVIYSETGFRYVAKGTKNGLTNYPIQGASANLMLYAINGIVDEITQRGLKSRVINTIHDAVIVEVADEELDIMPDIIRKWMIDEVVKANEWIDVPMSIDMEIYKNSWADEPIKLKST